MITLAFRFPAGRYHATPWGSQVNEGVVEWPPSPWRLLRAFISCGYTRLGWGLAGEPAATAIPAAAQSLLLCLAETLPAYTLPPATLAHSRHYMPIPGGKTTLILDTWAEVDGTLLVHWPVDLEPAQRAVLEAMLGSMNYLGRSESWVEGQLLPASDTPAPLDCVPLDPDSGGARPDQELVTLMTPCRSRDYASWRAQRLPQVEPGGNGKQPTAKQVKDQQKAAAPYPADLLDALQWDTARWKGHGWSQPPGSASIRYLRPHLGRVASQSCTRATSAAAPQCDMVLLALASASGNLSALPTLARTLPQAELIHKALVGRAGKAEAPIPPELSGCDAQRHPLQGHTHAHILPMDLDADGHLDHVLLWAPQGFGAAAMAAIRGLRRTWMKGGADELRLALAGQGFQEQLETWPGGMERHVQAGRVWKTLTPFVPPRFVKQAGRHSPEGQIRAELASRGFPVPDQIELRAYPSSGDLPDAQATQFRHFVRRRTRGGAPPPQDLGWFVRLTFPDPVQGPICLGYGGHFGLGLFQREPE